MKEEGMNKEDGMNMVWKEGKYEENWSKNLEQTLIARVGGTNPRGMSHTHSLL